MVGSCIGCTHDGKALDASYACNPVYNGTKTLRPPCDIVRVDYCRKSNHHPRYRYQFAPEDASVFSTGAAFSWTAAILSSTFVSLD